jgi:hypothetical protein
MCVEVRVIYIDGSDVHAEELINFRVLERLSYFLDENTEGEVLFEVLWVLTNVAAGPTPHTTYLVDHGFLQPLGKLLNHPSGAIRTQVSVYFTRGSMGHWQYNW